MKALTTSELNQVLISKGFEPHQLINISTNKWDADYFIFREFENGRSTLELVKRTSETMLKFQCNYNKFSAKDKKDFIALVLG